MLAEGTKEKRICETAMGEMGHRTRSTEDAEEINTYSTGRCPASTVDMRGPRPSNDIYSEKRLLERRYPVFHSSYYCYYNILRTNMKCRNPLPRSNRTI